MFTSFESYFFTLDGLKFCAENVKETVEVKRRYYNGNCFLFETLFRICTFYPLLLDGHRRKKCKNQTRKKKRALACLNSHISNPRCIWNVECPNIYKFNFILLCNLILAYFNALENCVAPFQLIRVIPKWLLARMKIRVKGMKCMSAKEMKQ